MPVVIEILMSVSSHVNFPAGAVVVAVAVADEQWKEENNGEADWDQVVV